MKRLPALALLIVLGACSAIAPTGPAPRESHGDWEKLPNSPLSARYASHLVEVGGKLYVLGGTAADPCPPGADCVGPSERPFSDGATFDPETQTWAPISDAPMPIGQGSTAVVGRILYLLVHEYLATDEVTRSAFLSYDPQRDRWKRLSLPPEPVYRELVSTGPSVIAFQASQENGVEEDYIYDPSTDRWSTLPPDPLRPSYDRWMVATDAGFVLTAISTRPRAPDEPNLYEAALLVEDEWTRFGTSEIFGYNPEWSWTGGAVLNPSNERADGGETNNWGTTYNAGGSFDPATGEWGLLPNPPQGRGEFQGISAAGDRYAIAYSGWVFDAVDERWLELSRPEDGPEADLGAAWVGDELYIFGGVRWEGSDAVIFADGWVWTP